MHPKISVIVPVYNVEPFIHDCINSILNQTFTDFELILVNDGSTDQSGSICDEYAAKDQRIRVIHKENGGQSSARNRGIEASRGQYLGFVDSDDWIHKDMYEILHMKLMETDSDITACNLMQYAKDSSGHLYTQNTKDELFDRDSAMRELYLNERLTFSPCNKLYKRDLLEEIRFKEGSILEDMDFSYRVIHQANKVYYTGQAFYYYRYNEKSTMRATFSKKRLDEYEVRKNMYLFYRDHYPEVANEVYAEWFLTGLMLFINIDKYFHSEKSQYKYLLKMDRKVLTSLVFKKTYDRKKRILLALGIFSPPLLVNFYRMYWEKLKKEL